MHMDHGSFNMAGRVVACDKQHMLKETIDHYLDLIFSVSYYCYNHVSLFSPCLQIFFSSDDCVQVCRESKAMHKVGYFSFNLCTHYMGKN